MYFVLFRLYVKFIPPVRYLIFAMRYKTSISPGTTLAIGSKSWLHLAKISLEG